MAFGLCPSLEYVLFLGNNIQIASGAFYSSSQCWQSQGTALVDCSPKSGSTGNNHPDSFVAGTNYAFLIVIIAGPIFVLLCFCIFWKCVRKLNDQNHLPNDMGKLPLLNIRKSDIERDEIIKGVIVEALELLLV